MFFTSLIHVRTILVHLSEKKELVMGLICQILLHVIF